MQQKKIIDEYNEQLAKLGFPNPGISRIEIYEDRELNMVDCFVEVFVHYRSGLKRLMSIQSYEYLQSLCSAKPAPIYTTGTPFIAVDKIDPPTIVKAVWQYLTNEEGCATSKRNEEVYRLYGVEFCGTLGHQQ